MDTLVEAALLLMAQDVFARAVVYAASVAAGGATSPRP